MSSVVLIFVQKENYTSKENISCVFSTVIGSVLLYKVKTIGILHCRDRSDEWKELWEKREVKKLSSYLGIKP